MDLPGIDVRMVRRCSSTNTVLLQEKGISRPILLLAEEQTAGRGRRGRRWHSAPGASITFSLARQVRRAARELPALSLVAGVAVTRALRAFGVEEASLKWPNDLVAGGGKLGGILVQTRSDGAVIRAVIGIGINCRRDPGLARRLRRPVASLDQFIPSPDTNALVAAMAGNLIQDLDAFEAGGLEAVREEWERLHAHAGQRLRVRLSDGRVLTGVADGLAENGALRLRNSRGLHAVQSGRVISARGA